MRSVPKLAVMIGVLLGICVPPVSGAASSPHGSSAAPRIGLLAAPASPLSPTANKRYLVDRLGHPFLIVGDSPQALIVKLSLDEVDRFLADRRAMGFNAVWVNLLCNTATGGRPDATTYD